MRVLGLLSLVVGASATFQPLGAPFKAPVTVAPGYSAQVLFSNLTTPRGITFDSEGNLLVVERGFGITAFTPTSTPSNGWNRTVVIQDANFTQGIQIEGNQLYASTGGDAWVFEYDPVSKAVSGNGRVAVSGLPPDGDLTTHTLQIENTLHGKSILIASGPLTNIDETARDPSSGRSQIRRFALGSNATQSYLSGELIAYGIRNPAGFAFSPISPASTLFVVENGASIDNVTGLTATFVNDNPADELESVDLVHGLGRSYGFPDCTTIWNPKADPAGDPQYVNFTVGEQFSLELEADRDNDWCSKPQNNLPPSLSFQAHSVPLDIKFYTSTSHLGKGSFPPSLINDAVVSFHGSFDRTPPTGYGIVHVPFTGGLPKSQNYTFLIQAQNLTSCPGSCIRAVGLAFGKDGKLYASSDSSGELFVLEAN